MSSLTERERAQLVELLRQDPVDWMEHNFYVEDPRDPQTGERLPPGPIRLMEHQKKILRAALLKQDGKFRYGTIVYSTIKKSGKTRVAAGVAAWFADTQGPYNEVYCLANDGKQSMDRILSAIRKCVELNPGLDWNITKTRILLPNQTFIEAIPCDATGQAGSNPGLTVWSEMWGYTNTAKERLWSEMTIPPTRHGEALRLVESYAGYIGESHVLWNLYEQGRLNGVRLLEDLPVFVNERAGLFCYWDEGSDARRMPWQRGPEGDAYYRAQAITLNHAAEFDRIHRNQWVSSETKALPIEWWDACQRDIPPLLPGSKEPVVMAVDAAVHGDCTAMVMVSRDPKDRNSVLVRGVRVWEPPPRGGQIDLRAVQLAIIDWCKKYNVVLLAYDEYQLALMMSQIRQLGIVRVYKFSQAGERSVADKKLRDLIAQRRIGHDGNRILRSHIDNAMCKLDGDKFRFVRGGTKDQYNVSQQPIDALIALSMATHECLRLNIG